MRSMIAAAALLAASPSFAAGTFSDGPLRITFSDSPCDMPAIAAFLRQVGPHPKHALVEYAGSQFKACYAEDAEGDFLIVDERGSGGYIQGKDVKGSGA